MKICILHIGHMTDADNARNPPSYIRFQRGIDPFIDVEWIKIAALEEPLPENPYDFDGYLITGGNQTVYEDHPWQNRLMDFIRVLHKEKIPLVGVCYGHQAIAHALGGIVELSEKGYGIGIKDCQVIYKPDWMQHAPETVSLYSMHKQQVKKLPEGAISFLTSDFCKEAGFVIGNHMFAIQQHPDFNAEVSRELIEKRHDQMVGIADKALKSLTRPHHTELSCQWIADFFAQHKQ